MNTQENNKMIAEFIGMQSTDIGWYDNEETLQLQNNTFDELQFHKSWNWLMPVVDKIEQVHEGVPQELIHLSLFSTRDEVYNAVVEFINEYNKNK